MTSLLEPYRPQLPISQLVVEVNRLYHALEAKNYDLRHPEVHRQLPPLWQQMIEQVTNGSPAWRILDFGCGTGFEAEQLLRNLPPGSVAQLICYDSSAEMLDRCRARIAPLFPETNFLTDLRDTPDNTEMCNLLATNSLLHHLPDPVATINTLLPLLTPDSVWLAGHEPSNRYYNNVECERIYESFLRQRNWARFFSPWNYARRLKQAVGLESNPAKQTAREAFRRKLFGRKPPASVISRLVDFHVSHSVEETAAGRGFDFELIQRHFEGSWHLVWVRTYSFMGVFYEGDLSTGWVLSCRELARKFPKDGANFCAVWKRSY